MSEPLDTTPCRRPSASSTNGTLASFRGRTGGTTGTALLRSHSLAMRPPRRSDPSAVLPHDGKRRGPPGCLSGQVWLQGARQPVGENLCEPGRVLQLPALGQQCHAVEQFRRLLQIVAFGTGL